MEDCKCPLIKSFLHTSFDNRAVTSQSNQHVLHSESCADCFFALANFECQKRVGNFVVFPAVEHFGHT